MHKRIVFKGVLKFTLKLQRFGVITITRERIVSLLKLQCDNIQLKYVTAVDLVVWLLHCWEPGSELQQTPLKTIFLCISW